MEDQSLTALVFFYAEWWPVKTRIMAARAVVNRSRHERTLAPELHRRWSVGTKDPAASKVCDSQTFMKADLSIPFVTAAHLSESGFAELLD